MNITEESHGQTDVDIMAPWAARDKFLKTIDICFFSPYLVCPCKISAPARAAMEAAAGARAAALGVGAGAWHSAPNLEARGGETQKQFFGLKFQTGLRRRGGIGARPRRGARGLRQPYHKNPKKSARARRAAPQMVELIIVFPIFFISIQRRRCPTAGQKRMLKLTHVDKDHASALTGRRR